MKRSHMALSLLGMSYLLPFLVHCGQNESSSKQSKQVSAVSCVVNETRPAYSCFEWLGEDMGTRGFQCAATGGKISYASCDRSKAKRGCKQEVTATIDGESRPEIYLYWWGPENRTSCRGEDIATDAQPLS